MTTIDHIGQKQIYNFELTTKSWKEKRKQILERDNWQCRNCNDTKNLQVHHRQYHINQKSKKWQRPFLYHNKYLITLCAKCHETGHTQYQIPIIFINH